MCPIVDNLARGIQSQIRSKIQGIAQALQCLTRNTDNLHP